MRSSTCRIKEGVPLQLLVWEDAEDPRREENEHCKAINLRSGKNVDIPINVTKKGVKLNSSQEPPQKESMLQQPNHQDIGVSGQAAATMEGNQPINDDKEIATPVVTTYNKPNEQRLIPPESTQ